MAGTGNGAPARPDGRRAAARRGPRRRVPGRPHRPEGATRCRASASTCCPARPSASSASRAAGSRPPAGRSCSCRGPPTARCAFEGRELTTLKGDALREARTQLQMIFQDPISSLNPRRKVARHRGRAARHLEARRRQVERSAQGPRGARGRSGIDPDPRRRAPAAPVLRRPVPAHLDRPRARRSTRS